MRIQNKLFAYFFLFSLLLVVLSLGLVQVGLDKGMLDYVNAREARVIDSAVVGLAEHYKQHGHWQALEGNHPLFRQIIENAFDDSGVQRPLGPPPHLRDRRSAPPRQPGARDSRPPHRTGDKASSPPPPLAAPRHGLLDKDRNLVIGHFQAEDDNQFINIVVDGETVGYVAIKKHMNISQGYELNFVAQLNQYLFFIGIFLIALTAILTLPLAKHLTRPIRKITASMNNLTQGHYDKLFMEERNDELGILARDVNELARTLEQNHNARQRWLADVSHELRTPVAILQAHIDAMLDGIRPMNEKQLASANEELKQLQRLIEDLHELARSDIGTQHYRKKDIDLLDYLPDWLERHKIELLKKGIELRFTSELQHSFIHADPTRLQQLFDNLLTNTAKYAHHADKVEITLFEQQHNIGITLEDNGDGVPEDELPMLFDHMYRGQKGKQQLAPGSGIGLAICKKIVQAHHGEIMSYQSTLGGLGISIQFNRV